MEKSGLCPGSQRRICAGLLEMGCVDKEGGFLKEWSCEGHPDSHVFERMEYIGLKIGILASGCFMLR